MNVCVFSSLTDRCGAVQPCCQPFIEGERDIWADITEQDSHSLLSTSPGPTCFRHHCGLPPFAVFYLRNSRENLKISETFSARKYWYHIMANSYTMVKIERIILLWDPAHKKEKNHCDAGCATSSPNNTSRQMNMDLVFIFLFHDFILRLARS